MIYLLPFFLIIIFVFLAFKYPDLFIDQHLVKLLKELRELEDDYKVNPTQETRDRIKHLKQQIELCYTDG